MTLVQTATMEDVMVEGKLISQNWGSGGCPDTLLGAFLCLFLVIGINSIYFSAGDRESCLG